MAKAPEWLARTQAVCFGAAMDGLPEPYGWVSLIVGPAGMLIAFIVIFRADLVATWALLRSSVLGNLTIIVVVATTLAETVFVAGRIDTGLAIREAQRSIPNAEEGMPEGWPRGTAAAPELGLVDQAGSTVTLASLRGKLVVLTFAFAHCQTICPTLVKRIQGASGAMPEDVELLIVTLDPWRDTPAALPSIAAGWSLKERQRVLSGPLDEVSRVLDAYNVQRGRDDSTGDVSHPALVVVIDRDGRLAYMLSGPATDWAGEAVRRLRAP